MSTVPSLNLKIPEIGLYMITIRDLKFVPNLFCYLLVFCCTFVCLFIIFIVVIDIVVTITTTTATDTTTIITTKKVIKKKRLGGIKKNEAEE